MSIIGSTQAIHEGNKSMFLGPNRCGKTRTLLSEVLRNYAPLKDVPIYVVDPLGDVALAIRTNLDGHYQWQLERLILVKHLRDCPTNMREMVLAIDDGRGTYSMLEHARHFQSEPKRVFSTIHIIRDLDL